MCSKRTRKLLYGVGLQNSLEGSCLLLVTGKFSKHLLLGFLLRSGFCRYNCLTLKIQEPSPSMSQGNRKALQLPWRFTSSTLIQLAVWSEVISGYCIFSLYLGDFMQLLLTLISLCSSVIPYFYPAYLLILLIWRERRDEARCSRKYKEIWAEYCKLVPWRILPFVY